MPKLLVKHQTHGQCAKLGTFSKRTSQNKQLHPDRAQAASSLPSLVLALLPDFSYGVYRNTFVKKNLQILRAVLHAGNYLAHYFIPLYE